MKILVTGGTGLLGNNIVRLAIEQEHQVDALVRSEPGPEIFAGADVNLIRGELLDQTTIDRAVRDSDVVIHSAGVIHLGWKRMDESMRINRDGTAMIADSCRDHDRKLILVGSVNTLAVGTAEGPANEQTPLDQAGGQIPCSYVVSKRAGVAEVLTRVEQGLRATIVHPGFMLGPWDWKPSSGRMMVEVGRNWTPIAPPGGCSVCDPRDVAAGTLAAVERGGDDGRQYILAGENWTYKKLWTEMSIRMGSRPPVMKAGPLQLVLAGAVGDLWTKLSGKEGDVNSAGVKMSSLMHWHDSSRAIAELGYQPRSAEESLDASAAWIKQHHMLDQMPGRGVN